MDDQSTKILKNREISLHGFTSRVAFRYPFRYLISDALPFGGLWYVKIPDAIEYAKHHSRSHDAVIRVYDAAGKVIEVHRHKGDFKEP